MFAVTAPMFVYGAYRFLHAVERDLPDPHIHSSAASVPDSLSCLWRRASSTVTSATEFESDASSDVSGHARRFLSGGKTEDPAPETSSNLLDLEDTVSSDVMSEKQPKSISMQEVPEVDIFGQPHQRRNSACSVESNESSLSTFFSSIPGMVSSGQRLETISSDVESESNAGSSTIGSATKEQISSVLHKLQGRAANYKDKYRELVKSYNEVVRENDKCRTVLAATQDKALQRIEKLRSEKRILAEKIREMDERLRQELKDREVEAGKEQSQSAEANAAKVKRLQELLEKCKISIKEQKEKIQYLTDENEKLKQSVEGASDEQGMSDFAVERVTAEWKGRVDNLETEWTKRLRDSEEKAALTIAKVKAEMHAALEEKEIEVQNARAKCKQLESQGSDVKSQLEELKSTIEALESEKADMVEKLSQAKQQGVKAVRDEEERKRAELLKEEEKKRSEDRVTAELKLQAELKKNDEQWRAKLKEQEEQMQLAIEEREMQKVAAVMEHDRRNDNLGMIVEQLTAEKLQLVTAMDDAKLRHRRQMDELSASLESNAERHKAEISALIKEHEEIVTGIKKDFEEATIAKEQLKEQIDQSEKKNRKKIEALENQIKEISAELNGERKTSERTIKQQSKDLEDLRKEFAELRKAHDAATVRLKEKENSLAELSKERALDGDEIITLRQQLEDSQASAANNLERLEAEILELKGILEEKSATIRALEAEKESLAAELAANQDLSMMQEHLQEQLNSAQVERNEAEKRYLEMERRAERAAAELEEDRKLLKEAQNELEKSRCEFHSKAEKLSENNLKGEELERMRSSIEQTKAEGDAMKERLERQITDLSAQLEAKSAQINETKKKMSELEEEVRRQNCEKRGSEEEIMKLKEQLAKATADQVSKCKDLEELSETLVKHKKEMEIIRLQRADLEKQIDEKTAIIENLNAQNDSSQSIIKKMQEDEESAKEDRRSVDIRYAEALNEKDKLFANLQEEKDAAKKHSIILESKISVLQASLNEKVEELQRATADKVDLEKQLRTAKSELVALRSQLEAQTESLRLAEDQLHELENTKLNLANEMAQIKTDRDGLAERLEEMQKKERHSREQRERILAEHKRELANKDREIDSLRSSLLEANHNEKSKIDANNEKIQNLEAHNEKLRDEFLQKEVIVADLQSKIDKLTTNEAEKTAEIGALKAKFVQAESRVEDMMKELLACRNEAVQSQARAAELEKESRKKREEEVVIRNQYEVALENSKNRLAEAEERIAELDLVRVEKERLAAELAMAKDDSEKSSLQAKHETELAINEIKKKAEMKLAKIKKQHETDVQAAKAELFLQLNEISSQLTERNGQIDEYKLNIAALQQQLVDVNELKSVVDALRIEKDKSAKELEILQKEMNEARQELANAENLLRRKIEDVERLQGTVEELEKENNRLKEQEATMSASETEKIALLEEKAVLERSVKDLEKKLTQLETAAKDDVKKALAKADADRQQILRELQKEIKQLYQNLNERSQQLDEANAKIKELTSSSNSVVQLAVCSDAPTNTNAQERRPASTSDDDVDHVDYEEVQSLREQISQHKREIAELREEHRRELSSLRRTASSFLQRESNDLPNNSALNRVDGSAFLKDQNYVRRRSSNKDSDCITPGFAEPTEAEYLRNVLYRYMNERETLGKESVTLARVIATVAKFSREQLDAVIAKEEQRNHRWYGGTVSTVQNLISSAHVPGL